MTAKSPREPLRTVLASIDAAGLRRPCNFPALVGKRAVRVVELIDEFVMVQPLHDTRSWELVALDLVQVVADDITSTGIQMARTPRTAESARGTRRR
jgi:hypothetical protein